MLNKYSFNTNCDINLTTWRNELLDCNTQLILKPTHLILDTMIRCQILGGEPNPAEHCTIRQNTNWELKETVNTVDGICFTLSTLIPGTMFCSFKQSTIFFPSVVDWYRVSSKRMEPEMYCPKPGVVNKSCLQACLLASVLSNPIDANLFPQVAFDSSIARIPRPGDAIVFYSIKK